MAKSEGEREHLHDEIRRLTEKLSDDAAKHTTTIQKLEGKIADLEMNMKDLVSQKDSAVAAAAKANEEVSRLKIQIEELSLKHKSTEKELNAAKLKLGDVAVNTCAEESLEAKVAMLTTELECTKLDLEKAKERNTDYHKMAKASETQLAELTAASTKYKEETAAELERLKKSEKSKTEAVTELTKDLMSHRSEKEKAVNELKAKIHSLTVQLNSAKEDSAKAVARSDSLSAEIKSYQLNAKNAQVCLFLVHLRDAQSTFLINLLCRLLSSFQSNYERELALHAEARALLRDARSDAESEQRLRETAESQLASVKAHFEAEKGAWESAKAKLEESLKEAKTRLEDLRSQNNILHDQMTSLSATVEKFQSDKTSELIGYDSSGGANSGESEVKALKAQLSDLRQLVRFKQSECTMLEADLASAKRATERERTASELAKRSAEEARSELKVFQESIKEGKGGAAFTEMDLTDLRNKLKSAEEQLVLIRESNTMLREESQRSSKKLAEVQSELNTLKSDSAPQMEKMKNMEVEKASLEAEKASLSLEVEAWKQRVQSLVSKFNQVRSLPWK